jgi:hypothetical protein
MRMTILFIRRDHSFPIDEPLLDAAGSTKDKHSAMDRNMLDAKLHGYLGHKRTDCSPTAITDVIFVMDFN